MNKKAALAAILTTVFLDFFNLGLIYPIFSSLVFEGSGGLLPVDASEFYKNVAFGILITIFPLGQFFGAPVIGQLSDQYGRRKLLIYSLIGTVTTLLICAFGVLWGSLVILLFGRLAGGLMAGNMTIAFASLSDYSDETNKVKNFSLIPFMTCVGFAAGPLVAGILANPELGSWAGPMLPFFVAALFSFINLLLALKVFPETFTPAQEKKMERGLFSGIKNLSKVVVKNRARPYLWIFFLLISANFLFVQFLGPFATERFHIDVLGLGYLYTNIGVAGALGNFFITRLLNRFFSLEKAMAGSLISLICLLIILIFSPNMIFVHILSFLIMLSLAGGYTNAMALVSNQASKENQGEIMGVAVSIQNCSEFLPAMLVSLIAALSESLPMAVAILFALGSYLILRRQHLQTEDLIR